MLLCSDLKYFQLTLRCHDNCLPAAGQQPLPRADSSDLMIVEDEQQHDMGATSAQTNGKGKRKAEAPAELVSGKRQKEMEAESIELD